MSESLSERSKIEAVLGEYFEGYLNAESELIANAFHPETRLLCIDGEKLDATAMNAWLENLAARKLRGDLRQATREVLSVDVTATAAMAKVRLTFQGRCFTDYLSLLRIDGAWRIVGKVYSMTSCEP